MSTPRILIISLHYQDMFEGICGNLLEKLQSKATVQLVNDQETAAAALAELPSTILITDEALTCEENATLWDAVLNCTKAGSTSVFMGQFSSFVVPGNIKTLFAKANLPWESASYNRTPVVINQVATGDHVAQKLPETYSQKAVFLKNVAPEDTWYMAEETGESAIALARVGQGRLGYAGDVNSEEETESVILAICGLL